MVFAVWQWTAVPVLSVAASQAERSSNGRRYRSQAFVSSPTAMIIYLGSLSDIFFLSLGGQRGGAAASGLWVLTYQIMDFFCFSLLLVLTNRVSGGKKKAARLLFLSFFFFLFFLPRRGNARQLCRLTALSAQLALRRQVIADHRYRSLTHTPATPLYPPTPLTLF